MDEVKPGNQCYFHCFSGFSFLVFLSSLGILVCSIRLFITIKSTHLFATVFLLLGLSLLALSVCSFQLRKAPTCMLCFLLIDVCIFAVALIFSLVLCLNKKEVESWARDQYAQEKEAHPEIGTMDEYVNFILKSMEDVSYAMLTFTGVIGLQIFCGYCYRESTIDRTAARREKLEQA